MRKYLAEMFGTMMLVLLACGSAVLAGPKIGVLGIGLCFGLVLVCLCYIIGNVSGCHVNPAVSFGMLLSGRMSLKDCCFYVLFQLIGAGLGAACLFWLFRIGLPNGFDFGGITPGDGDPFRNTIATNVLQEGVHPGMALLTEILLTMFFVLIVLGATSKEGAGPFAGLAIGLALGLVNIVGIPVDNCSVNPARSFGPALFSPHAWHDIWIMIAGPFGGAILAVCIWKMITGCKCKCAKEEAAA
ncbi:MAG: aquaporin [Muribaculaceae bacterium]|nr:aquaporin [Muribaculaceae bacterium]